MSVIHTDEIGKYIYFCFDTSYRTCFIVFHRLAVTQSTSCRSDQEPHLFEQFQTTIVFCTALYSTFELDISLYSYRLMQCFVECNELVQFMIVQSTCTL